MISLGLVEGGQWLTLLVVVALINSIVSLVYYGRIVKAMYFDAPLKEDHLTTPLASACPSPLHRLP